LGAEIIIRGKLRTDRARYEKFRAGYLPKSGHPPLKYIRKATLHVQLKPGMFGVKVNIMPPDAKFPDRVEITEAAIKEETKEEVKELKETEEITEPTETAETEEAMKEEETKE